MYVINSLSQGNVYQPVERRKEVTREKQRDMEQAFERLFVKTHGEFTTMTVK